MRCMVSPMRYRIPSRSAAALQQGWPVPLGPSGARATTLFDRNSTSCLIGTYAGLLPWLRLRTVLRHPCLQTRGGDSVAAKSLSTGHLVCVRTSHEYLWCGTWFARLAHSRRSCFASAGWDSLANHSLGLITLGFARSLRWKHAWLFFQTSQFKLRTSFPALVPMATRLASMPSQPYKRRHP